MDVIPREKALEEEEMLVETPGRKKYHHIRRKKEKSKKETHGMVFKVSFGEGEEEKRKTRRKWYSHLLQLGSRT